MSPPAIRSVTVVPETGSPGGNSAWIVTTIAVDQRVGPRGHAHDRKRWGRSRREDFVAPVTPTEDTGAAHVVGQGRLEVGERRLARRRQRRDVQPREFERVHQSAPSVRLRVRFTRGDDRATDAFGDEVDVEHGVGADHVDVAVEALELVVEVVHATHRSTRGSRGSRRGSAARRGRSRAAAAVGRAGRGRSRRRRAPACAPRCRASASRRSRPRPGGSRAGPASVPGRSAFASCRTGSARRGSASNSSSARVAAPTAGIAAVSDRNGMIGMRTRYGSPGSANTCGGGTSDTRRAGTVTSVATMSRLPVAAMPSTCHVSLRPRPRRRARRTAGPSASRRRRPWRSATPSRRGRCRWRTASAPTTCTCRRPTASPGRTG